MVRGGKFKEKRVTVEASGDDVRGITDSRTTKELIDEEINAYMRDDKEVDEVSKDKTMALWLSEKKRNRFPT